MTSKKRIKRRLTSKKEGQVREAELFRRKRGKARSESFCQHLLTLLTKGCGRIIMNAVDPLVRDQLAAVYTSLTLLQGFTKQSGGYVIDLLAEVYQPSSGPLDPLRRD